MTNTATQSIANPMWYLISTYGRPHAVRFIIGMVGKVIAQIPGRLPALFIGIAIDSILFGSEAYTLFLVPDDWIPVRPSEQVAFTVGILAIAVVADLVLNWSAGRVYGTAQFRTIHEIRVDTFSSVVERDMEFFDDRRTGDLVSILNNDVTNLRTFGVSAIDGIGYGSRVVVAFILMASLHWPLALVLVAMPVTIYVLSRWYTANAGPLYDEVREKVGTINNRLEDSVDGIATVKAFNTESHEYEEVRSESEAYRESALGVVRKKVVYNVTSWFSSDLILIITFFLGGYLVIVQPSLPVGGGLTPGALMTFILYGQGFYRPLREFLLRVVDDYENARASSTRICEILEDADDHAEARQDEELTVTGGTVTWEDVTFTYPGGDRPAVEGVEFSADAGEFVGIVGPTGAGKSTIAKLLFRFYDPDDGTICVDGTDISTVSPRSLRESLGYVPQDPIIFDGTVRENIAYANPTASEDAVVDAARAAGAHEFIDDLPDGYDTEVGQWGNTLSGGQRQRLAIARALVDDPPILVFDEATSHVDAETEVAIRERIDELATDRTIFAVAHRLSTVREADQILVMERGRLCEHGTHEELLAKDGFYADLWRAQVGAISELSEAFLERVWETEGAAT